MPIDMRGLCPLMQVFDMPTSVRFYRDILGFELVEHAPLRAPDEFGWCLLRTATAPSSCSTPSSGALRRCPQQNPRNPKKTPASPLPHRQAHLGLLLGSPLPGQSHPRAPAPRPRPRLRLLGLPRLRPGHAQPLRRRPRHRLPLSRGLIGRFYFYFAALFALACAAGIARPLHPPLLRPPQVARRESSPGNPASSPA
jgi:catechol 2,3-dioxygenase-like lactoylglutathione lyase family enzyme